MEKDIILSGVKIGEHSADPADVIGEIKERVIAAGSNFVYIRPSIGRQVPQHYFIEWARFLAENKIYFHFGYTVQSPPPGKDSQYEPETIAKINEIAGEYYLGDAVSELGGVYACKFARYSIFTTQPGKFRFDFPDMEEAHEAYKKKVSEYVGIYKKLGVPHVLSIEATAHTKYNLEAGATIPILETPNGDPDILTGNVRGAARGYNLDLWGSLIAHEWYGGMRHEDVLKRKRLELTWKYMYLAGSSMIYLESGDEEISSYGHKYGEGSVFVDEYRKAISDINNYIKNDSRPKGGPKVKFAFVSGLHDSWCGFFGSSAWNQFGREEWGYGESEHSWRILDELGTKRKWADVSNFGDNDLSAYPAYGNYDIIPIESSIDVLSRYDYLIFMGWNTMTDENMDKLTEYVRRGGKLLMTAAHLNYNAQRNGALNLPSAEKFEKLFGCRPTGKTIRSSCGTKFNYDSIDKDILYSGTKSFCCDPMYSGGYTEYLRLSLCGATPVGYAGESFPKEETDVYTVIENKVGDGFATLVTSINYPGCPALYPMYRALVREFVTSSARNCEIKVLGSDRLRWAVYEGGKVYLLNTDYDMPIAVKVIKGEKEHLVTLDSLELKTLEL